MAKDKKAKATMPEGMECFQKKGGGSLRFPNHIIKPGQIFCIDPNAVPDAFKDTLIPATYREGVTIVNTGEIKKIEVKPDAEKIEVPFVIKKAKDESGAVLRDGNKILYNVVAVADNKVVSEKALTKSKAQELADAMNS